MKCLISLAGVATTALLAACLPKQKWSGFPCPEIMRSNENGCDYPSSGSKITMVGFGNCSQGTVGGDVRKIVSSDLLYAKVDSIRVIYSSGTANYDIDPTKYYNYTKLGITVGVRGKSYSWKDASLTESDSILEDVERGLRNIEEQIVAAENRPVDSYVSD